jgi:hypothetical protein
VGEVAAGTGEFQVDRFSLAPLFAVALLLGAAFSLCNKLVELFSLLGDAVGCPLFVPTAGGSRRLFDKLTQVVSQDRDPIVEFRKR